MNQIHHLFRFVFSCFLVFTLMQSGLLVLSAQTSLPIPDGTLNSDTVLPSNLGKMDYGGEDLNINFNLGAPSPDSPTPSSEEIRARSEEEYQPGEKEKTNIDDYDFETIEIPLQDYLKLKGASGDVSEEDILKELEREARKKAKDVTKFIDNSPSQSLGINNKVIGPVNKKGSNTNTNTNTNVKGGLYESRVSSEKVIKNNKILKESATAYMYGENEIPSFDNETIRTRLSILPTIIPLEYNEQVQEFINMYVVDNRNQVQRMLAKTDLFFPVFEAALDRQNLPMELKYLPVIESALIPHAKSSTGASGLWQLPYRIAQLYGLAANSYIDERNDPTLASEAAALYLKTLYKKYKDWYLVIAAFNCGEGTVNKAIKRSGNVTNYWDLAEFLPEEYQSFVPLYIAATYVMNYYADHNLHKYNPPYSFYLTDTVVVRKAVALKDVGQFIGMPIEELQFLNPALKQNVIPYIEGGYPFVLPVSKMKAFEIFWTNNYAKEREIITNSDFIPKLHPDSPWNYAMDDYSIIRPGKGKYIDYAVINYKVNKGETLSGIALKFDCSLEDLKKWNNLSSNSIKIGQELIVVVNKDLENYFRSILFEEE